MVNLCDWNDRLWGFGLGLGWVGWWFSGILCVLRTRPLRFAKGRKMLLVIVTIS